MIPDGKHLEEIARQSGDRDVAVPELQASSSFTPTGNHGILVRQESLLDLPREGQFLFDLVVALLQGRRGLSQGLLGPHQFRYITGNSEGSYDFPHAVDQLHLGGQNPGFSPPGRRLLLDITQDRLPGVDDLLLIAQGLVRMILPKEVVVALADDLLGTLKAVPLRHRLVDQGELRVPILEIDVEGNVINEQPHEVALFQELLLHQLPRRNIDH